MSISNMLAPSLYTSPNLAFYLIRETAVLGGAGLHSCDTYPFLDVPDLPLDPLSVTILGGLFSLQM